MWINEAKVREEPEIIHRLRHDAAASLKTSRLPTHTLGWVPVELYWRVCACVYACFLTEAM